MEDKRKGGIDTMANQIVCPHCGSKNTEKVDNHCRCCDCMQDFGREEYSDQGNPLAEAVRGLRFRYGDIVSGSVRLRMVEDGNVCVFEVYDANEGGVDKVADVISKDEWKAFKDTLYHKLYLADWDRVYIPVNDGQRVSENNDWELGILLEDDEETVYCGYDEFPAYWKEFLKLIDPFFARLNRE